MEAYVFIVTTDPDGEPDRKVFDGFLAAKAHAARGRAKGFATTIHEVHATSANEAASLIVSGAATLVESRGVDLSPSEKMRRVNVKQTQDLMRDLGIE